MTQRLTASKQLAILSLCLAAGSCAAERSPAAAPGAPGPGAGSAAARMNELGPEGQELARRTGTWDVTITARLTPDAAPMVTTGVVAERSMVGTFLHEEMRPAPGSAVPDFRRICYLGYSRVEGRWQYVSLDTRFPVGIMPAWSFDRADTSKLTLLFEPIAFVGLGPEVEGRMIRSNLVITRDGDDHDRSQQYFVRADGTGQPWLAVQYEYRRKR
jgi:hypothetical protein